MANMRAQVSLQFVDEDLYENFVLPYKEERRLNSIIIKCLSAYYRIKEVRNLIEGGSLENETGVDYENANQVLIDEVRQALVMQDFMSQELQNVVDNGVQDVEDILDRTNKMAESTGVAHTEYDEKTGATFLRISALPDVAGSSAVKESSAKTTERKKKHGGMSKQEIQIDLLTRAVEILAKSVGNTEVEDILASELDDESESGVEASEVNSQIEVNEDDDEQGVVNQTSEAVSTVAESDIADEEASISIEEEVSTSTVEEVSTSIEEEVSVPVVAEVIEPVESTIPVVEEIATPVIEDVIVPVKEEVATPVIEDVVVPVKEEVVTQEPERPVVEPPKKDAGGAIDDFLSSLFNE